MFIGLFSDDNKLYGLPAFVADVSAFYESELCGVRGEDIYILGEESADYQSSSFGKCRSIVPHIVEEYIAVYIGIKI